jgi:EAL domain-containing protein (putative c-di-GMP-specific phosphodiesterase class I)/AmiR/NasT family two-component response regulator
LIGRGWPGTVLAVTTVGTSPPSDRGAAVGPIKVLIADDEPSLREALAELFAHEERVVLVGSAGDAEEAIELAVSRRPDVAILDVNMPAGGGARAAREIIRVSPATRVIALSAFEDRPTVLEMLRAGAVGYLVKGGEADHILDSIARVVDGGASLSSGVIDAIVDELSSQLRREEIELEQREARREQIGRFVAGKGVTIVYQPILDLRTREIVGTEALSRFHSLPLRPSNEWFTEAVGLELGVPLELSTIRRALPALAWLPEGKYLSVNCSHRAAMSGELADAFGAAAPRIVVEITEHEPVEDYGVLGRALADLRAAGVRIAIDDAGAGFASLRHTLRLRPDIVKIDISIVRDVDRDRGKRALASALTSFADEMGMAVIAEGIETHQELAALREIGVAYGQGFLLAEPAPRDG